MQCTAANITPSDALETRPSQGSGHNSSQQWTTAADIYANFAEQFTARAGEELIEATEAIRTYSLPSTSVLDVGCGSGSVTGAVRAHSPTAPILAVDASAKMVDLLSKKALPTVRVQVGDALDLLTSLEQEYGSSARYSHVLSTFMIQFTNDPKLAVREMHRVLRPHGVLGLATWGEHDLYRLCERVGRKLDSRWTLPEPYSKLWPVSEHEVLAALQAIGFAKVKVWKIQIDFVAQGSEGMIEYAFSGQNPANEAVLRAWRDNGRDTELKHAMTKTAQEEGTEVLTSEALMAVAQKV